MTRIVPLGVLAFGAALATACGSAPLTPSELCASADELAGQPVEVGGYDELVVVGRGAALCDPGVCCNPATYTPSVVCPDGPDILLMPADSLEESLGCEGQIGNDDASASECSPPTCGSDWETALGTLSSEMGSHPTSGEPVRVLTVETLTLPTR